MEAILLIILGFAIYFAPSFVASRKEHEDKESIFILNLLLGWSLIGWVIALVWAFKSEGGDKSLIKCPDCKKKISKNAKSCPNCGNPIKSKESKN